jgi:predicted RND superfamily exporter protein
MADLRECYALSRELDPHVNGAINGFLVAASIYKTLLRDLPNVAALALISVLLIFAFDLRQIRLIFIGSLSFLTGLIWAAGSLVIFDIRINIINVAALPMLLGIGIDIIVHLQHRLRSGDNLSTTLRTTGIAVFLSTATTISAFFSLTLANSRGLQSMGFVVLIGLSAVFLSSLMLIAITNSTKEDPAITS